MEKYWVSKGQGEYMILTDEKEEKAGNTYVTVESGFDTKEGAEKVAKLMNTDFQLYVDSENAMCYHDPSERMKELGYSNVEGKWVRG